MKITSERWMHGSADYIADINARLRAGAIWNFLGSGISRGALLISAFFLAHLLGQSNFGRYALIQQTIFMFQALAVAAIGNAAARHIAQVRQRNPDAIGRVATLCFAVAIVISLCPAAYFLPDVSSLMPPAINDLRPLFLPEVIAVAGIVVFSVQLGIHAGFEEFAAVGRSTALMGIASALFSVVGAAFEGVRGAAYGLALGNWCGVVWGQMELLRIGKRECVQFFTRKFWLERQIIWSFSLPSLLSNIVVVTAMWIAIALLGSRRGGFDEVGIFNAANQLFLAIVFVPTVAGRAILPILSNHGVTQGELVFVVKKTIKVTFLVVVAIATVCASLGEHIMAGFGRGFAHHGNVLLICIVSAIILAFQIPLGQVIIARGYVWAGFFMNFGWAAVFLFLAWMLLDYGAVGLAAAQGAAYVVHALWTVTFALHVLNGSRPAKAPTNTAYTELKGYTD